MVGGIRYLAQCIETELEKISGEDVLNDEVLLVAWDTLGIAVCDNSKLYA